MVVSICFSMNQLRKPLIRRLFTIVLIFLLLVDPVSIQKCFALTGGPSSPEFSSFEPVSTTNMVNEFTGDFTYNLPLLEIPGPEGSGYPLSLSYHSGSSPEEEASWVGYGWTLNPGAINRGKKGYADDHKGAPVTTYNDVPNNWTATVGGDIGNIEIFGEDSPITLGLNASIRYNNYKGFGYVAGLGFSVKGVGSLGYSVNDGLGSFSYNISPSINLEKNKVEPEEEEEANNYEEEPEEKEEEGDQQEQEKSKMEFTGKFGGLTSMSNLGSSYGLLSRNYSMKSTSVSSYVGSAFNISGSIESMVSGVPVGPQFGFFGSFNSQNPVDSKTVSSYGYLYSGEVDPNDSNKALDYYSEQEAPYSKRDLFLSVPFSNVDNYSLTGEGLGGSFRPRAKNAGHFFPTRTYSATGITNLSLEFQTGLNNGVGADMGSGLHELSVKSWVPNGNRFNSRGDSDEAYTFRFKNDLGGDFHFGSSDIAQEAAFDAGTKLPNTLSFEEFAGYSDYNPTQVSQRSGRSTYIGYHTNEEMMVGGDYSFASYSKDGQIKNLIDRSTTEIKDQIGEFITTNEDGMTYTFGLPVYSRNEVSLQYGFKNVPASNIESNYLLYADTEASNIRIKTGQESLTPYATTYLLTSITSPDYIDRTFNGPSKDDIGSWTRFTYKQVHGSSDKTDGSWYRWRIPYTGFLYNRNSLSNERDDLASYTAGEKEICYLDTVETKTHFAVFDISDREDGREAPPENIADSERNPNISNLKKLKKLDAIRLYAKPVMNNQSPHLLQTITFKYEYNNLDYELMSDLPNSTGTNQGKLTLKAVYTEYEGVNSAKISPYIFHYNYPSQNYPSPYTTLSMTSTTGQNPVYSKFALDPWGNYQSNGDTRHSNLRNWIDQNPAAFDPAAWQLKVIKLPSGGEIHVQYEQKDYLYVQDRRAMAMVRLESGAHNGDTFFLDINEDLGPMTPDELLEQADIIRKELIDKEEKIYFKFLYALIGSNPSLTNCQSEYIKGYATVENVGVLGGKIFIQLKNADHSLPIHVCRDYVKVERGGNIPPVGSCNPSSDGMDGSLSAKDVALQLLGFVGSTFSGNAINCLAISHQHSYLRIPLLRPKKGGGIRVKRLMMYDNSLGEEVLFGNEYHYQIEDPITKKISSSGVATNEPATIREECALTVNLQKRTDQGWLEKAIAGRDLDNFEGPIGESILPSPSIGYRRVYKTNIHRGRTNPGFTINEFFTSYDYPFDKKYAHIGWKKGFDKTQIKELHKEWMNIPSGLFDYQKSNLWMSQGFHFINTEFNGKPKRSATYTGNYAWMYDLNKVALTSSQEYTYYQPGEKIPISNGVDMDDITYETVGKEVELLLEGRVTEDINDDFNIEGDGSLGFFGLIALPFATAVPSASYNESKLHTHVSTKITSYPAITKSVKSFQDGVYSTVENLAFSKENGRALLTRTYDGYRGLDLEQSSNHHGTYLSYAFAGADEYPNLGQRAFNEGRKVNISNSSGNTFDANTDVLSVGDLIQQGHRLAFISGISGNTVQVSHHSLSSNSPFNASLDIEVIRSGKANRLHEDAGTLTVYGDEINVDFITVPTANLAERQAFADFLSNAINSNVNNTSFTFTPNNLTFEFNSNSDCTRDGDRSQGCRTCSTLNIELENQISGTILEQTKVTIRCGDRTCCFRIRRRAEVQQGGNINSSDIFSIHPATGTLIFHPSGGEDGQRITMCPFCESFDRKPVINGVINASSVTYSDNWRPPNCYLTNSSGLTDYELGAKGKWRVDGSYVYREDIFHGNDHPLVSSDDNNRNYHDAGVYKEFMIFDWQDLTNNNPDKWLKTNQVNLYSPHGQAIEEQDIRGVKSSAKYGYYDNLPYLVANNAGYNNVSFESFEVNYRDDDFQLFEDCHTVHTTNGIVEAGAHSGSYSLLLPLDLTIGQPVRSYYQSSDLVVSDEIKNQGLVSKVWVKVRSDDPSRSFGSMYLDIGGTSIAVLPYSFVARTGEWTLYECQVAPSSFASVTTGTAIFPKITFEDVVPSQFSSQNDPWPEIRIDDVRFQPTESQMTCYVYDPNNYRLLSSLDDQHFGLVYQYNREGKLVRKVIETERGYKTVQETQYYTPEIAKW